MSGIQFTLVINNPASAITVLQTINKYARVFAKQPIRILRADSKKDEQQILSLGIKAVPSLIVSGMPGPIVGNQKICAILEKYVHDLTQPAANTANAFSGISSIENYQLRTLQTESECEDEPIEKDEMMARIAQYRKAMSEHGAHLFASEDGPKNPRQGIPKPDPQKQNPLKSDLLKSGAKPDLSKTGAKSVGVPSQNKQPRNSEVATIEIGSTMDDDDASRLLDNYKTTTFGMSTDQKQPQMKMPEVKMGTIDTDEAKFFERFKEQYEETRMVKK